MPRSWRDALSGAEKKGRGKIKGTLSFVPNVMISSEPQIVVFIQSRHSISSVEGFHWGTGGVSGSTFPFFLRFAMAA